MDFEKESNREAFEVWFESRYGAHFMQFALDLDLYVDKHTQTCWEAWQAAKVSAVLEGYVLMPIKPTETMVMAVVKEHEGDAFLPYSLYDAYVKQAMIEAQEQSHDS